MVGGGTFTVPVISPEAFSLGTGGAFGGIGGPGLAYHSGTTYLGWVNDAGQVQVASYDHATETVSSPVTIATTTAPDGVIHNAPAVLVRDSDKRIMVAWVPEHGSVNIAVSTNAEDVSAFDAAVQIHSDDNFDYCSLIQLRDVANQPIYLFTRPNSGSSTARLSYTKSSDDGATWSAVQELVGPVATNDVYWRVASASLDRIDLFVTSTDRSEANPSALYHFIFEADTLHQSDGTEVAGPYPVAASAGSLVHDNTDGSVEAYGWAYDESGLPSCVLLVYDAANSTNLVRVARWTGAAWDVTPIDDTNGWVNGFRFDSGATMAHDDPGLIYAAVKVGSKFEIIEYRSTDDWATWTETAITSGSSLDNTMPEWTFDHVSGLRFGWRYGTLTSGSDFDFTIYGYGA